MDMIIIGIVAIAVVGVVAIISDAVSDYKFAKEVENDPCHWARVNPAKQKTINYVLSYIDSNGVLVMERGKAAI